MHITEAPPRKRILFVDDEQHVLDGLQNLLRRQRRQWDMAFVSSGEAALEELGRNPFDVVVSDMRMPRMDGATLLRKVKENHPSAARIVLSGHAERDAVLKALPVAHQYLSKPCDPELIRVVIERACALQSLLNSDTIRALIGGMEKLPSVPQTYWELTRALTDPDIGVPEIARIVETDPAMSAKVLQVVNSAYFGLAQQMSSVTRAVSYLGTDLLKGLSLNAQAFASMGNSTPVEGFSIESLQQTSLLSARIGGAMFDDTKRREDAFTACLVHDIGQIILALSVPERWAAAVHRAAAEKRHVHEVEREMLGVTHGEVGAYLLGAWGLPFPIVEAVAYHHVPGSVSSGTFDILAAVHVADALALECHSGNGRETGRSLLDMEFLGRIGAIERLPQWRAIAEREAQNLQTRR